VYDDSGFVIYRLDLGVEELRLGVEYDGEAWHSSDEDRAHDVKRRTALEDLHGYRIDVFRREHVFGQREIVTGRLPAAVREARSRLAGVTVLDLGASRDARWRS
jgi:very-short-patch-repair endonuclease